MGRAKAPVFPDPVCAKPITSFPAKQFGLSYLEQNCCLSYRPSQALGHSERKDVSALQQVGNGLLLDGSRRLPSKRSRTHSQLLADAKGAESLDCRVRITRLHGHALCSAPQRHHRSQKSHACHPVQGWGRPKTEKGIRSCSNLRCKPFTGVWMLQGSQAVLLVIYLGPGYQSGPLGQHNTVSVLGSLFVEAAGCGNAHFGNRKATCISSGSLCLWQSSTPGTGREMQLAILMLKDHLKHPKSRRPSRCNLRVRLSIYGA